jgi:hypothetical protein
MIAKANNHPRPNSWVVVVTRGTQHFSPYAIVPHHPTAQRLCEVAISLGYRDATVMRYTEFAAKRAEYFERRYEIAWQAKVTYFSATFGRGAQQATYQSPRDRGGRRPPAGGHTHLSN